MMAMMIIISPSMLIKVVVFCMGICKLESEIKTNSVTQLES